MTDDAGKRVMQVTCLVLVMQMFTLLGTDRIWLLFLPSLVAFIPIALLTVKSPVMIERTAPRLRQYYTFACLIGVGVITWFLASDNQTYGLDLMRIGLADFAILQIASTLGVQVALAGNRDSKPLA
jgi:hypothetical protein